MNPLASKIRRIPLTLSPDPRRVLLRPFAPSLIVKPSGAGEPNPRIINLFLRVMHLDDFAVEKKMEEVLADFHGRHERIREIFAERFEQVKHLLPTDLELTESRRLLLGSYFTNEYSLESSALFNPSIVGAPDQSNLGEGELRFILSLRATGEGHISCITFRSGIVTSDGGIRLDEVTPFVHQPRPHPAARYDRKIFRRKLQELGIEYEAALAATRDLPESFLMEDLVILVRRLRSSGEEPTIRRAADRALLLAQANYTVCFDEGLNISEKILFPYAHSESNGIEDARFVRFQEPDGSVNYYAPYTAYDGNVVLPQMVQTQDFREFTICTLNGPAVRNKGLALFPRKIDGHYAMLGRQDGENIHLMFSDHLHFWYESKIIVRPSQPWEFVQLGNCGSPIETRAGWLVLTHGVGPMRKYCIGAVLLDRDDPSRVIGRLREPLLYPAPDEREGYVPNVVYSCGSIVHGGNLILPYAISDTSTRFAVMPLDALLEALCQH
ncbi:MAG: glycoside hydrolase family 130 protein [Terrimicrobiaceae bacterium]